MAVSSLQLQSIPGFNWFVVNFVTRLRSAPLFCVASLQQGPPDAGGASGKAEAPTALRAAPQQRPLARGDGCGRPHQQR